MKKIMLVLAVIIFAAPALGEVQIFCVQTDANEETDHEVTVFFDATSESDLVRGFALDITISKFPDTKPVMDANITSVVEANSTADYYVNPSSIAISGGSVTNWGTPLAVGTPPCTSITVEMGSLYATSDPDHPQAPAKSGTLCTFRVDRTCQIELAVNSARGGVIMEDGSPADVNFVGQSSPGGEVTCRGDVNKDGKVKKNDMAAVSAYLEANAISPAWTVSKNIGGGLNPAWDECADNNPTDKKVKKNDMGRIASLLERRASSPAWTYICP